MPNDIEIRVTGTDATGTTISGVDQKIHKLAGSVSTAGRQMDDTAKRSAHLGSALLDVSKIAGGILLADMFQQAGQAAKQFIASSVTAASDLGESLNAVNKIFDENSQTVLDWGEKNAASFGLSQRAFNQMATPLGAMLKNSGLTMDQTSDHTLKLTQRAADMASVFNTDVTDALMAIQAGLRGEQDPLERYGVSLSAAAVEARAMADTGKTSAMALTAQEKALARLNVIYDQTNDSAGDFRDTADGLANSQRIAAAEIENAKSKIGTAFIPVMAAAAKVTGNVAGSLGALPPPALLATAVIGGLGAAALLAAPRIHATKIALDEMLTSSSAITRFAGKATIAIGKLGAAFAAFEVASAITANFVSELNPQIEAAAAGLEDWQANTELSGESARLFGKDLEHLTDAFQQVSDNAFARGFASTMESLSLGTVHTFKDAQDRVAAFDASLAEMVRNGYGEQAMLRLQTASDKSGKSVEEITALLPQYSSAAEVSARSTEKLSDTADDAAVNVDALSKSVGALIGQTFGLEEAEDRVANAIADLRDQVKQQKAEHEKGAAGLDRNTQAGRDNAAAVRDLIDDYKALMIEYEKAGKSTAGLQQQLENTLVSMGFSRAEAKRYTQQIGLMSEALSEIPPITPTTIQVSVQGAREAERELNRLRIGARVDPADSFIGPVLRPGPSATTGHAAGGPIGAEDGGWTRINEHGQEIARLPTGTMVYPAGQSAQMAQGVQRVEVLVRPDVGAGNDFADAVVRMLRYRVRTEAGGDAQAFWGTR